MAAHVAEAELGELPHVELEIHPAMLDAVRGSWSLPLALVRNVARTPFLRRLLDALEEVWGPDDGDADDDDEGVLLRWPLLVVASAEFLGEAARVRHFAAQSTQRVRLEADIGRLLVLSAVGFRPLQDVWGEADAVPCTAAEEVLRAIAQPALTVFDAPAGSANWEEVARAQHQSNFEFVMWAQATAGCTEARDYRVRPSLLGRDAEPPRPRPFSAWEIHQLESALELHRQHRHSERQAANAIAQALGPRLPAALHAWDQVHAKVPHPVLKRMKGHLKRFAAHRHGPRCVTVRASDVD